MNTPSNMVKVAVVGGEGIGPEVTAQSHRILNWFAANRAVPITLREAQYGLIPYLATGKVLEAAYAYLNWWMNGWAGAVLSRQGYYMALPERARRHLAPEEWAYWYEGQPAAHPLPDPLGRNAVRAGERRDGGSYRERMAGARVWNSFMDEHTYLVRRWNEFLAG